MTRVYAKGKVPISFLNMWTKLTSFCHCIYTETHDQYHFQKKLFSKCYLFIILFRTLRIWYLCCFRTLKWDEYDFILLRSMILSIICAILKMTNHSLMIYNRLSSKMLLSIWIKFSLTKTLTMESQLQYLQ